MDLGEDHITFNEDGSGERNSLESMPRSLHSNHTKVASYSPTNTPSQQIVRSTHCGSPWRLDSVQVPFHEPINYAQVQHLRKRKYSRPSFGFRQQRGRRAESYDTFRRQIAHLLHVSVDTSMCYLKGAYRGMQVVRWCQAIVLLATSESEKGDQQCKKNRERTATQGEQVPPSSARRPFAVAYCILCRDRILLPLAWPRPGIRS